MKESKEVVIVHDMIRKVEDIKYGRLSAANLYLVLLSRFLTSLIPCMDTGQVPTGSAEVYAVYRKPCILRG